MDELAPSPSHPPAQAPGRKKIELASHLHRENVQALGHSLFMERAGGLDDKINAIASFLELANEEE